LLAIQIHQLFHGFIAGSGQQEENSACEDEKDGDGNSFFGVFGHAASSCRQKPPLRCARRQAHEYAVIFWMGW